MLDSQEANETAGEFIRERIRETVNDPAIAEALSPNHMVGCKRLCADNGYFETFNLPNVTLVDVNADPIEKITPDGLRTRRKQYDLDAIVFATGFDAMTGAVLNIDIRGSGLDDLTDRPMRWLCAEMIREGVYELLDKELPYSMAVEVLRFDESSPKILKISANLLVERDSQKRIVVGRGGSMVKKIGTRARRSIEEWVGRQVHLELFVKVDPGWLKNGRRIEQLGYH